MRKSAAATPTPLRARTAPSRRRRSGSRCTRGDARPRQRSRSVSECRQRMQPWYAPLGDAARRRSLRALRVCHRLIAWYGRTPIRISDVEVEKRLIAADEIDDVVRRDALRFELALHVEHPLLDAAIEQL